MLSIRVLLSERAAIEFFDLELERRPRLLEKVLVKLIEQELLHEVLHREPIHPDVVATSVPGRVVGPNLGNATFIKAMMLALIEILKKYRYRRLLERLIPRLLFDIHKLPPFL